MSIAKIYYCESYDFECEKYLHLLDEERLLKYSRLKQEKDRKNCVGAYLLLKSALEKEGITSFEIIESEMGKPYIKGGDIHFNLSHCRVGFACGISRNEIGIDIEELVPPKSTTIKKAFSETEQKFIADNERNFTKLWTFKESIIKRNGEGIGSYKKYEFPFCENDFYAFGNRFVSIENEKFALTACGDFEKIEFIKMKTVER